MPMSPYRIFVCMIEDNCALPTPGLVDRSRGDDGMVTPVDGTVILCLPFNRRIFMGLDIEGLLAPFG